MSAGALQRFIKMMALATFVGFTFWIGWSFLSPSEPGDYYVREGDNRLGAGDYEGALESFANALRDQPDHRGALMGRAVIFLQSGRLDEAEAEFSYLIDYLSKNLAADDGTGWATLASAFANRGILYDRTGRYELAVADYARALRVDEKTVSGPGIIDDILLYDVTPSTVRDRALYLQRQLALPESERRFRIPERDAKERMYKP